MTTIYTFNSKVLKNTNTSKWLIKKEGLPPIPANTVRVRTSDGNPPIKKTYTSYETATLVTGTTDVYDVYKSGTSFNSLFSDSTNIVEVLGGNTTGITDMTRMFEDCTSLTTIQLFDTSSVTDMIYMFLGCSSLISVPLFDISNVTRTQSMLQSCTSLTSIPLFNTSKVTEMSFMFYNCPNVQSGALALYNRASTQTTPPSEHDRTFFNCGSNTTAGAAELAQIPTTWGGTMSV